MDRQAAEPRRNGPRGRKARLFPLTVLVRKAGAAARKKDPTVVPWGDGWNIGDLVAAGRPVAPEVYERDEYGNEEEEVIHGVALAHALMRPGAEGQEVLLVDAVFLALLREAVGVKALRLREALERGLQKRREHDGPFGHGVSHPRQRHVLRRHVWHQRRRRPKADHLAHHRFRVAQAAEHLRRDGRPAPVRPRGPLRRDLRADPGQDVRVGLEKRHRPKERGGGRVLRREEEVEEMTADLAVAALGRRGRPCPLRLLHFANRLVHPEVHQAGRLRLRRTHSALAVRHAAAQSGHQAGHCEPRLTEGETWQVEGKTHEADVEEVVVDFECAARLRGKVGAGEDRLRGLEVHVPARKAQRNGGRRRLAPLHPLGDVRDDDGLLEANVGGERLWGEIRGNTPAQVLVLLPEHVDQVVLAEELAAEGMANDLEGIRADVGEDAVRDVGGLEEDDEAAENVIGAQPARRGRFRQVLPVGRRIDYHRQGAPQHRYYQRRAWERPLLPEIGQLLQAQQQNAQRHRPWQRGGGPNIQTAAAAAVRLRSCVLRHLFAGCGGRRQGDKTARSKLARASSSSSSPRARSQLQR